MDKVSFTYFLIAEIYLSLKLKSANILNNLEIIEKSFENADPKRSLVFSGILTKEDWDLFSKYQLEHDVSLEKVIEAYYDLDEETQWLIKKAAMSRYK